MLFIKKKLLTCPGVRNHRKIYEVSGYLKTVLRVLTVNQVEVPNRLFGDRVNLSCPAMIDGQTARGK